MPCFETSSEGNVVQCVSAGLEVLQLQRPAGTAEVPCDAGIRAVEHCGGMEDLQASGNPMPYTRVTA